MRLHERVFMLSEAMQQNEDRFQLLLLDRHATVHGHCHHKSVLTMDAEQAVMENPGLDFGILDSGCCGMADRSVSKKKSMTCPLPAVRGAAADSLIIADGFNCRERMLQTTDREPLHLAQVVQRALRKAL